MGEVAQKLIYICSNLLILSMWANIAFILQQTSTTHSNGKGYRTMSGGFTNEKATNYKYAEFSTLGS